MNRPCSSIQRYPVGATWTTEAENGAIATVSLKDRHGTVEMWIWLTTYSDGSSGYEDRGWTTSRRTAVEEARFSLSRKTAQRPLPRMRRVEGISK